MSDEYTTMDAMKELISVSKDTTQRRGKLIDRLEELLENYQFDPNTCSSSERESFTTLVNGLGGLMNDQEKSKLHVVRAFLQQKEADSSDKTSEAIVAILDKLTGYEPPTISGGSVPEPSVDAELDDVAKLNELAPTEGEVETIDSPVALPSDTKLGDRNER